MSARVAINGFGRIGRNMLRAAVRDGSDLEFVAINDLTDPPTLAHLLKHDSVHGAFSGTVEVGDGALIINGAEVKVLRERDPAKLPWKELGADIVIESTGLFRARADAQKHLDAGARKVLISAPAKGPDVTICLGVNADAYDPAGHHIISNASCTTNCLAPVAKVLNESFGIERGWMTAIHAYTSDQRIHDLPHSDLRRARAAAVSMIPTTTGAAKAVALVLPELEGKLDGCAVRVPTPNVSMVDLVAQVAKATTADEVNDAFRAAAASGPLKKILAVSDEPLVSIDYNGDPRSSTVDAGFTSVVGGSLVQVMSWYDNEMGYSTRLKDLAEHVAASL
ncbi:MAG TPA: type I glyceraldehyde-3-phosphate dehydrogenase [Acidobacteriota bacterium]|jgi:glyceraldehyde 3-phosphate dehydrogenase